MAKKARSPSNNDSQKKISDLNRKIDQLDTSVNDLKKEKKTFKINISNLEKL